MVFLTLGAAFSVSGLSLLKSRCKLKASEFDQDQEDNQAHLAMFKGSMPWLAEPLTDKGELLRSEKDSMRARMELMVLKAQKDICYELAKQENSRYRFRVDRWEREEGGGGITCIIQDGDTFEKAGVNISVVHGIIPPSAVAQMNSRGKNLPEGKTMPFFACGISSVIHPRNPNVPTIHFNFRYFEVEEGPSQTRWWFGGGCDLTPYYLDEDDAKRFHRTLKHTCDKHNDDYYEKFKTWCDNYFKIKHRGITRGIGGIFFDDLDLPNKNSCFQFVKDCTDTIVPIFLPMVKKHKNGAYGYKEREWQLIRRGHYAEFNLVYDRGTKFGLYTPGARYESILMSLPLNAKWSYMYQPKPGSREEKLTEILKNPQEWV
ncbi:hypothetical protein TCAL_08120 [Tigriopus californicus]|uniref:coproporphyrinogen oxidase n=1 Tax=Tigriopus californicus TaxID=6832 RepID=A0A553PLG0_TIGCA|nr:oxygen-dependent coproporphyrinogen-III oxidase-like [Tigriopus californicus]XP_059095055.1 oxygen-dependent coproporphyrinogen-III oxidase-like [Tigriopus californicus]TRY78516.1 hypothetical protein TCAL_08120 [Tigriopus californicus]